MRDFFGWTFNPAYRRLLKILSIADKVTLNRHNGNNEYFVEIERKNTLTWASGKTLNKALKKYLADHYHG